MKLKAYAKVNLILKVVGKFDNGYHDLQMLNTKIDLYDEIIINEANDNTDRLIFKNSNLDPKKDNLVIKCLQFVKDKYNIKKNYEITIIKNIPIGAGLGGGSSDAATIIKYIMDENNIKITEKFLNEISKFGADIPYFLIGGLCIVEGIGEKISKIELPISDEFVLVNPNIYINTKEVYKNNTRVSKKYTHNEITELVENEKYMSFNNDLEESCFKINEQLETLKKELNKIGYSVMSGSGSTMLVFGEDINKIYDICLMKYPNYYIRKVKVL